MLDSRSQNTSGFSLFELLISLAVISILFGISMASLGQGRDGRAVDSAREQVHGMLRLARSQAILNGTDARLIINYDSNDNERYLRFFGVIVRDGPTTWKAAHDGILLPSGIYFVPQNGAPSVIFASNWGAISNGSNDRRSEYRRINTNSTNLAIESYKYPDSRVIVTGAAGSSNWICYGFGPAGELATVELAGLVPTGSHISLAEAARGANGGLTFENSEQVIGIRIRSNGYSASVDDPNAL